MPVDLTQIENRLVRAKAQIETLESSVQAFRRYLKRNHVVVETEPDALKQIARIHFSWKVPDDWGLTIGEIAHHLRATLDNLVWQLVIANGATPGSKHEFPIAVTEGWFRKRGGGKLKGIHPAAFAEIERLQPFARTDGKDPAKHMLAVIHELDIIDKHQFVHVAAVVPEGHGYYLPQSAVDAGCVVRFHLRPLENGTPIMEFIFKRPHPEKVKVDDSATVQVLILETETTPYLPISDLMRAWQLIVNMVNSISAAAP